MPLIPKRVKYRKMQRRKMKGQAKGATKLAFGEFGLQSLGLAWINTRHIEAARLVLTRSLKKGGKLWIRIFADKPVTKKPAETRMGKGKGDPDHWVAVVKPGRIMFELTGLNETEAREAFRLAGHKFPIPTRFVSRLFVN